VKEGAQTSIWGCGGSVPTSLEAQLTGKTGEGLQRRGVKAMEGKQKMKDVVLQQKGLSRKNLSPKTGEESGKSEEGVLRLARHCMYKGAILWEAH